MKKCSCGFRTWNKKRFAKHIRGCGERDGRETVEEYTERPEVKEEPAEEVIEEIVEEIEDEGIDFEEMTVNELRDLARAEGLPIYGSKAALIERLKEGE